MDPRRNGSPILVHDAAAFDAMLAHLWERKLFALDTESDSLFSYYPKVCLIQVTTYTESAAAPDAVTDYLVDPLRFSALAPLGDLLANPACEVILHAAENDILLLQRDHGFRFARLFDTQLAARILGWQGVGLAAILEERFGVVSDKRMQRTNWGKRPLTPEQISYAQMDTHYLPALRRLQLEELRARDRWEEAQDAFAQLTQIDYHTRPANERTFWQMKETRAVPLEQTGVLEALWLWREQEAQRQDRPPFKIVNNQALAALAVAQPETAGELAGVRGLSSAEARRYGTALLRAIRDGKRRPQPQLPEPSLRPELLLDRPGQERYDALRRWRARVAEARGVAPDIVLTNDLLLEIVRAAPATLEELRQIDGIGPWKANTYGPDVLKLIRR
jgi:ribonuclease D